MTTLADLKPVFKGFGCGRPKTGKTGSLASLINTGLYNVRIISLDAGIVTLDAYVKPEYRDKVEVVKFKEPLFCNSSGEMKFKSDPVVFAKTMAMLFDWKHGDVDHGHVRTWGPNDVLVIDQLTDLCKAAMWNTLKIEGRLDKGPRKRDWGIAQGQVDLCMQLLASDDIPCNVIVLSHVKLIGPPVAEDSDDDDVKEAKRKVQQIIPYRLYPSALGQAQPPLIAGNLPYMLYYDTKDMGGDKVKRFIATQGRADFDISVPLEGVPKELDISDGLAKIFAAVRGEKPW